MQVTNFMLLLLQSKLSCKKAHRAKRLWHTAPTVLPCHRAGPGASGWKQTPLLRRLSAGSLGLLLMNSYTYTHILQWLPQAISDQPLRDVTSVIIKSPVWWSQGEDHTALHLFYFAWLLCQPARYQNAGLLSYFSKSNPVVQTGGRHILEFHHNS